MTVLSLLSLILALIISGCVTSKNFVSTENDLQKIEISKEALSWVQKAEPVSRNLRLKGQYPQSGYYECYETAEIKDTILCHFNNKEDMGYALARASCYIEGSFCGHEKGSIIGFNDPGFRAALLQINGYDLKGSDLIRFYNAVNTKCKESKLEDICPNHFERKLFEEKLLPWATVKPNYVLITFARFNGENWYIALLHEIMHAQYFQVKKYQEIVNNYWNHRVSEKEKAQIRLALSIAYDPKDELLMINEFQAYLLQTGADQPNSLLHKFVPRHRQPLMKDLKKADVEPIQIQLPIFK